VEQIQTTQLGLNLLVRLAADDQRGLRLRQFACGPRFGRIELAAQQPFADATILIFELRYEGPQNFVLGPLLGFVR
jgi:hypothetical protein